MSKGRRSAGDGSGLCHYMGCSMFTVHCTLNTEHGGAEHCPGTRDMVEVGILNSKLQSGTTTSFVVLHH